MGRLVNSDLESDVRRPIVLPRKIHLTKLIIRKATPQRCEGYISRIAIKVLCAKGQTTSKRGPERVCYL